MQKIKTNTHKNMFVCSREEGYREMGVKEKNNEAKKERNRIEKGRRTHSLLASRTANTEEVGGMDRC